MGNPSSSAGSPGIASIRVLRGSARRDRGTLVTRHLRQQRESHRVVRIGNRKPLRMPEQSSRRGKKGFAQDHRSHRHRAEQGTAIVECLRAPSDRAGEIALMIVGQLAVSIQPRDECVQGRSDAVMHAIVGERFGGVHFRDWSAADRNPGGPVQSSPMPDAVGISSQLCKEASSTRQGTAADPWRKTRIRLWSP